MNDKDRGNLLRMAGNIASGLVMRSDYNYRKGEDEAVAEEAVHIARLILSKVGDVAQPVQDK